MGKAEREHANRHRVGGMVVGVGAPQRLEQGLDALPQRVELAGGQPQGTGVEERDGVPLRGDVEPSAR
jgi:hypothetical protein